MNGMSSSRLTVACQVDEVEGSGESVSSFLRPTAAGSRIRIALSFRRRHRNYSRNELAVVNYSSFDIRRFLPNFIKL